MPRRLLGSATSSGTPGSIALNATTAREGSRATSFSRWRTPRSPSSRSFRSAPESRAHDGPSPSPPFDRAHAHARSKRSSARSTPSRETRTPTRETQTCSQRHCSSGRRPLPPRRAGADVSSSTRGRTSSWKPTSRPLSPGSRRCRDRFDEARTLYARSRQIYLDLGLRMPLVGLTQVSGLVELLAGDPEAAERELRDGYEQLLAIGGTGYLAPQAPLLALALLAQDRGEEAVTSRRRGLAHGGHPRSGPHVDVPFEDRASARRARQERLETAKVAVELAEKTDALNITAEAFTALALACAQLDLLGSSTFSRRPLARPLSAQGQPRRRTSRRGTSRGGGDMRW